MSWKVLELPARVVTWIPVLEYSRTLSKVRKKVLERSEKFTEAFESRFLEAIGESLPKVISAALKLMVAVNAAV